MKKKKINKKKNKIEIIIKKFKKFKKYAEINPTKLSWSMSAKSDKKSFYSKRKKTTKLSWPMSAKSDT